MESANVEQSRNRLRVVYAKTGRCAMLSHLEICRALERCVRRAGLPYAISQGFSPHMRIAFGAALPVGVGGTDEIFDVQLTSRVDEVQALEALRKAGVDELMPKSCSYIDDKAAAASVAYPIHGYQVRFSEPLKQLAFPEEITVVRKKKERTLVVSEFLAEAPVFDGAELSFVLETKPTGSLRADVLIEHLLQDNPGIHVIETMRVMQKERR